MRQRSRAASRCRDAGVSTEHSGQPRRGYAAAARTRILRRLVVLGGEAELPPPRPAGDLDLLGAGVDSGRGEDPAVVGATRVGRARRSSTGRRSASGSARARRNRARRDRGPPGAGNSSSAGMWASVSVSSGADVDELRRPATRGATVARHVGARSPRIAARISSIHDEKSPAGRSRSSLTSDWLAGDDVGPTRLVVPGLLVRVPSIQR